MAIDNTGISSLEAGAPEIKYTGDEGPKSPDEQLMAQADPMIVEMYQQYVFEMEEQGMQPVSFKQFLQQIMSESNMAEGGIARLGLQWGGPPGGGETSYGSGAATAGSVTGQRSQRERDDAGVTTPYKKTDTGYVPQSHSDWAITEKDIEKKSIKEKINEWHRKKQKAYYAKNYRKALEKFVTTNMKSDLPDWYDEDEEDAGDKLFNWINEQDLPDYYHDLEGRDLNKLWEKHGYVPSSDTLPGIAGAFIKSKPPTLDEVEAIYDQYHNKINYTNKEPDWLEEMKVRAPNQYAVYTGTNYDPIRKTFTPREGGGGQAENLIPYQTASVPDKVVEDEVAQWTAPEIPVGVNPDFAYAADGGRMGYAGGGIADLRQGYFLGKLVKKITRGAKKAFKTIGKVAKSPLGRMGLMALGGWGLNQWKPGLLKSLPGANIFRGGKGYKDAWNPWKLGIGAASLYPLIKGMGDDDDKDFTETDLYKRWLAEKQGWDKTFAPVGDIANWQPVETWAAQGGRIGYDDGGLGFKTNNALNQKSLDLFGVLFNFLNDKQKKIVTQRVGNAQGGRIGYAGGGYNDDEEEDLHRAAALSAMYRKGAQEGGLMDMGGMEKDYRNEGGFVPIGGQERADDVPARLSKNEFVFTADAVRAAGGGDIDKGAEVMENVMENLEKGGNVSEESQGLEGARNMFATSQRLEGVL